MTIYEVADSGVPLKAKRNRAGRCSNPAIHDAHDTCPGRERAAKIERPASSGVAAAINDAWHLGRLQMSKVDKDAIGIIPLDDIDLYSLDLESYEAMPFAQKDKFISFFTAVKRTNDIILDYASRDLLPLTLRQIHYQMVVRHKDYPNNKTSYDHMTEDLVQARMSGLVPWNAIDDPTRDVHTWTSWDCIQERIKDAADTHHLSRWQNQEKWPLVLVEKDAALGIISRACDSLDVPYASMKGYGSVTALRNQVAHHCLRVFDLGKEPVVIHLSDHDASGWDMPRNLIEYINALVGRKVDIRHIALTLEQILDGYGDGNPLPPDPVKHADPRAKKYIQELQGYGLEPGAWEMDALRPDVLHNIIVSEIESCRNMDLWREVEDREQEGKQAIRNIAEHLNNPLPNVGEMA